MTVPDYDYNVNAITTGTETLTRPEGLERAACEAVAPGATLQERTGLLETTTTAGPVPWERPGPTTRTTTAPRLEEPASEIATLTTTTTTGAAPWTEPGTTIAATEVAPATETETKSTLTTKAPQGVERAYWSTLATEAPQGEERACETATTTTIRAPQGAERATTDEDPRQPDAGENNFEEDANSCVQEPTKNTLYESVLRYALSGYPENPVAGVEHIDFMPPRLEPEGDVTRTPEDLAVTVKKTKETAPEEAVVGNADSASDTEEEPADMADSDRSREHRQPLENTQQGPARAALSTLNEDAESAHLERVGSVTDGTSEMVDNENDGEDLKTVAQDGQDKEGNLKAPPYKRLFTPEELDALADGRTLNAKEEKEEYDKELEERLPPLDEVELLKKRAQNAKKQKELTLEELSTLLKLPVETLKRTRESSPGVLSTPEYWISWYRKTLAASEEARRANRDFRETAREREKPPPISSVTPGDSDGRDVGGGDDLIGDELLALPKERERSEPVNTNEKVVERNICVTFAVSDDDDPPVGGESSILPSRWRALVRSVIYRMVLEDEERGEPRCNACRKPATNMPTGECVPVQPVLLPEDEREPRARELVIGAAGVLGDRVMAAVIGQVLEGYEEEAPLMRAKRAERQQLCQCHRAASKVLSRRHRSRRGVHYDCTSLFCRGSEALGSSLSFPENGDDISHYVCSVRDPDGGVRLRKPGLVEVEDADEDDPVPAGKRVICSVGGVEAVSAGHFEDLPAELLIDSGAIASLVESRVLTRLGLKDAPLRTYQGSLNGVSGHKLRIKGEIDLPLRLGSLEKRRPFVVVDRLHVDAILGTDTLKAFRAVVDLDENTMTLKDTGEVFPLGAPRVEETYVSRIASTVRLCPGGQALVTSDIVGKAPESATVLIEGLPELDANVKIARTLCSIHGGKTIVEVCNASTEELVIKKGTALAVATVVPKSALALVEEKKEKKEKSSENPSDSSKSTSSTSTSSGLDSRWVDSVISSAAADSPNARDPMPGLKEAYEAELEPDFSDSKLDKEQQDLMKGLLDTFRDMFVETSLKPGRTHLLEFSIDTGTNPPIKQPPYRVSHAEGEVMESEIQQYLELGLIQPSTSPWASPVLMIRKPDGGIRFCIDYRRLNAVTVKDCYPMPLIDDILDVLKGAKLFSTMDIASGYWNVPMAAGSVEKTAFTCKYGLFEWLVMPFGLCNAVPAFERLMENVLVDLKWRTCLVYLDDCVVFSTDFPTHLVRLKQVLERFRAAGFKLKMKKCKWGRDQVAFLGHIITPSGILPNPEKVKAVMNVARPHDLHTVRAFLGLTSYFRRYIPGFAAISAPIERLKVKGVEFVWNDDCEAAFLQLKRRLVEPPILVYPDFSKRFKLYVDSSHLAVGACLMQTVEGRERVIAYASKLLVGSERNWIHKQNGTSEIECWGIVWATRKFRCYLDRNEFDLYTDHKALTWVFSEGNRTSNAKLARWAMELSQLRFKVYHKPGTAMGHVDGLSRLHTQTICALSISDLLNDDSESPSDGFGAVGEGPASASPPRASPQRRAKSSRALDDALRAAKEALNAVGEPPAPQVPGGPLTDVAGDAGDEPDADGPEPDAAVEPDDEEFDYGDEVVSERPATSSVDIFGLDRERFVEEQKRTPWIQAVIAFLEYGALALDPQLRAKVLLISPHYVVRNGMLMRRVHLKARAGHARSIAVPVIPLPFVETVLHYCHADVFAAHVGQSKTMDKVRKHAYWHGWKRDVAEYVRACTVCGSGKGYRPWKNGLMQRMPVQELSGPFSLLVVDAIGPLVTTPRGNKYILVFADYFTRWVEAFPVEALDTITFVNIMIDEVLSRHGVPERLLSDRGTNFISDLAKSFYETLGIKKLFGAAYHPQTQGLVERFNGTLIGMLRMFVSEAQSDWDLYLPRVLFAYRTSYHEALGDSPFFSLYGRDPVLPLDLAFLNTRNEWKSNEVAEYRRRLYLSLRDTRRMVERQLLKAQDRHARRLDDQVAVEFCEGDAVWVYQYFRARRGEKKTKKLAFSWHGPYRIVGKVGDNTYKVAIPNHPDRVVPVNVNRLKKFAGRWSRPFPNEVPAGVEHQPGADDAGPFTEDDLPSTSFVERLNLGGEETAFSGVTTPIVAIIGKRMKGRQEQYMVFTASYETCWRSTTSLLPEFAPLIKAYEDEQRSANGWPELRRSVRLADANATVDEDELLF